MREYGLCKIIDHLTINSSVPSFSRKRYFVAFLFCLIAGAIYFYCAGRITHNVFAPTWGNYYPYLLDAFFHGRTNVTNTPGTLDLSLFENKWYMYWGPAPALLILPFYLLFHLQASDVLYTAIGGIVNVALFYAVMQAFKNYFHLSLSLIAEAFLVLSFGLASPNFYLSVAGTVAYTVQIFAVAYLLLFYLFYFRFLNSGKHSQLMLCVVFFCLACLSRYTLLFNGILFLYVFVHGKRSRKAVPTKIILSLALMVLAFVSLEALYNFVRFHNLLETGHRFQEGAPRFDAVAKSNQILSLRFFLHNAYYCFLNMVHFSPQGLVTGINPEGNSIFSVYPALLLLPVLFCTRKYANRKRMSFLLLAGIVIGLNLLVLMLYQATGWTQFGYRYLFDVLPLVFLLLMFILPSIPIFIQMGLLVYGILVNFYGIITYYGIIGYSVVLTDVPPLQETLLWIVIGLSILFFLFIIILNGMNNIVSFFRKKRYLVTCLFCLTVGAIYFYCAERITKNVFAPTWGNYYPYLLDAFFHGRTNVIPPVHFDLSLFEHKWYVYWGPAPVLLILPFYLLFHLQASDVLYTAIGGIVNVALFYAVMQAFKKCFQISLSWTAEAFLVLSFGLASPNFYLSVAGIMAHTVQIFAATYLLLFYLFYFRFLNSGKHSQLMLCAVFFCLACLSRYTLLFNGILFLYLVLHGAIPRKIILFLALLMLAFACLEGLYNFVSFHNMLEAGQHFQVGNPSFAAIVKSNQILSPRYVLYNIYYCFINILHFSPDNHPVVINIEGNSIFSVYPSLMLLPVMFCTRKDADKKRMSFVTIAGIVVGLNLLTLLLYQATGSIQFGYRYFFDVVPLIFLLLMFILPSIPIFIQMGLLVYGILVNFYGIMALYNISTGIPPLQETLLWIVIGLSILFFLFTKIWEET